LKNNYKILQEILKNRKIIYHNYKVKQKKKKEIEQSISQERRQKQKEIFLILFLFRQALNLTENIAIERENLVKQLDSLK